MKTIAITDGAWNSIANGVEPGVPVLTLNLLRFRDQALYLDDQHYPPCSGREAYYERYARITVPRALAQGGKLILNGSAAGHPVCPPDERWDDILMFEYPDITALVSLGAAPEYQATAVHRTASLADSRLFVVVKKETLS
ncbi:MAG: DUF1330 domain-containing protein [Pseudomonadota bacterium]